MTQTKDIYWLAGLLEGDGSFSNSNGSPHIQLSMADVDVVKRAQRALRAKRVRSYSRQRHDGRTGPTHWHETRITGTRAAGWMMTLYPLMGQRRQARIRELLAAWRG